MSESIAGTSLDVVVTGANGLVGARLCAALVERGATVRAVVRRSGSAPALEGVEEVLVLSGDTPLLTTHVLQALADTHRAAGAAATVLSFLPEDVRSYGRIVRDGAGIRSGFAHGPEAGDRVFEEDDLIVFVEAGLSGVVDVTESHDQLVLRPGDDG